MSAPSRKICVVGSAMFDQITRAQRLPLPGETVIGSSYRTGFGGKGSNQAVMAAHLGAEVTMVVKLGKDAIGTSTLENYRTKGIVTDHVNFDENLPSGVAPIWVDETTGQNSIIVVPGANTALSQADVRRAEFVIRESAVVVCQNEIPVASTVEAFRIARRHGGTITIYNPAPAMQADAELLKLTDLLIPNQHEAALISGLPTATDDEVVAAARRLHAMGAQKVVVTLGERGACVLDEDKPFFVSVGRVEAVDTTGAGDAFVGSLAFLLADNIPLLDAVAQACRIATLSVLKHGTQSSFPTSSEVAALVPNLP